MITEERRIGEKDYYRVHCETCYKLLEKGEGLDETILIAIRGLAIQHEQRHPTHTITIYAYSRGDGDNQGGVGGDGN